MTEVVIELLNELPIEGKEIKKKVNNQHRILIQIDSRTNQNVYTINTQRAC